MGEVIPTPVIPHSHELCDGCIESDEVEQALRRKIETLTAERDQFAAILAVDAESVVAKQNAQVQRAERLAQEEAVRAAAAEARQTALEEALRDLMQSCDRLAGVLYLRSVARARAVLGNDAEVPGG